MIKIQKNMLRHKDIQSFITKGRVLHHLAILTLCLVVTSLTAQSVEVSIAKKILRPGEATTVTVTVKEVMPGWKVSVFAVDDEEVEFRDTVIAISEAHQQAGMAGDGGRIGSVSFGLEVKAKDLGAVWGEYGVVGEVIPDILGDNDDDTVTEDIDTECCRCDLSSNWNNDSPIVAGLAYPKGTFTWNWAKPLPMKVVAYDVDKLELKCLHHKCKEGGFQNSPPECFSSEHLKLPGKPNYQWEITKVEILRKSNPLRRDPWPDDLPKGGFRARRNVDIGLTETGESVMLYHPFIEEISDLAFVTIIVRVQEDESYNLPKPEDSPIEFMIFLRFRKISDEKLEIAVDHAPEPPSAPDLRPQIATTDCKCKCNPRWENPSPIELLSSSVPEIMACGESIKLKANAEDSDRLIIWCEGNGCDNSVKEYVLSDPLSHEWSASHGSFPAGNTGETVVFKAPVTPADIDITLTIRDSRAQFEDTPMKILKSIIVRRHPVVMVPGLLASTLELDRKLIWPPSPTTLDAAHNFSVNWGHLILTEDGNSAANVTSSAMLEDENMYGRDHYGKMRKALGRANHWVYGTPYDWRKTLEKSALILEDRVKKVMADTGYPKVSIVCHSMGGLISRNWITHHDKTARLEEIVFVATPHHGAPKAYRFLRWGEKVQIDIEDMLFDLITRIQLSSTSNLVRSWVSFYYLLPTDMYFKNGPAIFYDDFGPHKAGLLESANRTYSINNDSELEKQLHVRAAERFHAGLPDHLPAHIKRYNVYSKSIPTEYFYYFTNTPFPLGDNPISVIAKNIANFWHGKDVSIHTDGDETVVVFYSSGDKTVPTHSARWQFGNPGWNHEYTVNNVIHSELTNARKTINYALYWLENLR